MSQLRLGRVPDPLGMEEEEDDPMGLFKSSSQAYQQDVVPRGRGAAIAAAPAAAPVAAPSQPAGKFKFDLYGSGDAAPAPAPKREGSFTFSLYEDVAEPQAKKVEDNSGDTGRGFSAALNQTPALLKGAVGYAGAVGEKAFGEGGAMTALKKYGLEGYQKGMAEIQAKAKDTDEVTVAWDKAKQGDLGALVDWVQYGVGYLGGNVVETVATSVLGGVIGSVVGTPGVGTIAGAATGAVGKEAVKGVAKNLVEGMVAKEAAKLAEKAGLETATDAMVREATKSVAKGIGSTTALAASGVAKSTGGIFGEAVEEAGTDDLSGGDLARIFGAGVVAGLSEAAVDRLGLDAAAGKIKIPGGGRLGSAMIGGAAGVGIEGGQELFQTAVERFGAAKELTGEDAMRDYINSFALGALGGGTIGTLSGALRGGKQDVDTVRKLLKDAEGELTSESGRQEVFDAMMQDEKIAPILQANGIESGEDPRFQTVITKALATQQLLADLEAPTADEVAAKSKERGADVQAAFGDTASTGVGIGTGANEQVIQRDSVVANAETRTLDPVDGVAPRPVILPEGKTTPAGTVAMAPEDIVSRQQGFEVQPAFQIGTQSVANRFSSNAQAETFLFGPINPETNKREGGFAASVPDMEFQIRQGQKAKEAGGGTFYFVEAREKQSQPAAPAAPAPSAAPAAPAPAAPAPAPAPVAATPAPTQPPVAAPAPAPVASAPATTAVADVQNQQAGTGRKAKGAKAPVATGAAATPAPAPVPDAGAPAVQAPRVEAKKEQPKKEAPKKEAPKQEAKPEPKKEAPKQEPKKTVEQKVKEKAKEKAEKAKQAEIDKKIGTKKADKQEVVDLWEDNDDGKAPHISWKDLPEQFKTSWREAVEDGYATIELHDKMVEGVNRSARAERVNAKVKRADDGESSNVFRTSGSGRGMTVEAVTKVYDAIVSAWAKTPTTIIVQSESDLPASIQAQIKRDGISGKVPGIYNTGSGRVFLIADNLNSKADVALTIAHEITGHFGLRRLLGDSYTKVMNDIYKGNANVRKLADDMMVKEGLSLEVAVEEVLADMAEQGVTASNRNALQQIFAAIRKWMRETLGISFVTDGDVRQIVANARRYVIEGDIEPNAGRAFESQEEVVAAMRRMSKTAAFRKWFGNSVVKDKKGEPLIVYHGTGTEFTKFDLRKVADGEYGIGFYFATNRKSANFYARSRGESPRVMEVYLRAERPAPDSVMSAAKAELEEAWYAWEDSTPAERREYDIKKPSAQFTRDYLEARGYDSYYNGQGYWMVLRPEQIKSVLNENPTENPDILKRQDGAATFYSALERAFRLPKISLDKNGAASADQWKSWLNSKKSELKVKDAEIEWTGIDNWFDLKGKEKLTPQQILDWVAGNRVYVNEVRLTSYGRPDESALSAAEYLDPSEDDVREFVREQQEAMDVELVSEAFVKTPDDMNIQELREWVSEFYGWGNYLNRYRREMERFQRGRVAKMTKPKHADNKSLVLPGGKNHAEIALFDPSVIQYKPEDTIHYGDITHGKAIGWVRMNERKDASGNDVLFIEELQSQRAQDGRQYGFASKEKRGEVGKLTIRRREDDSGWEALTSDGEVIFEGSDVLYDSKEEFEIEAREYADEIAEAPKEGSVPPAPFVEDTRAWTALLIKRAIAYAQERGIDRIAWTTGEQQNERYKFPGDELVYVKEKGNDNITLTVMKEGRTVRTVDIKSDQLAAFVGEKTAERINANEGVELDNKAETSGVLKGDDLKIMEANLQPYYNQTVPSVAKDLLKSFGGKVEVMKIGGTGDQLGFVIPEALQKVVEEDGLPLFRRKDYEAQYDDLDATTKGIALKKGHYSPPTIKERLEALRPQMWLRVVQGMFDRFRAIRNVDSKAYMMARLSQSTDGAVEGLLHYGQVFDDDGALNLKKGTKGLLEVLQPVGAEVDRFLLWIAANRAANLSKTEREKFFKEDEWKALQRMNLGTMKDGKSRPAVYAEALRGMNELNKSVLEVAKSAGHIDEAAYKRFAADIWYVPFYRIMEEDGSLAGAVNSTSSALVGQYMSKALKGSERPLNDLMQNVLMNWSHILSASMKNKAANQTLDSAVQMDVAGKIEPISSTMGKDKDGNVRSLKGLVKTMVGGKETYWDVKDDFLLDSLTGLSMLPDWGIATKIAREFKTTLTRFISLSPTFKINNLIRDSIQSIGLTELEKNPVANVMQGWRAYKDDRAEALVGGGIFTLGNAFDGDQNAVVKRLLKQGVKDADILTTEEKAKAWIGKMQDKYDEISDSAENANRLALYHQLRSKGASHLEAAYAARDIQDFSLQGGWGAIRYLSQVLPYFNARLQGMYKLGRDGIAPSIATLTGKATDSERQKAAKFGTVMGAVVLTGVALYLMYKDDEDYKKREDWDRDMFFWVKIGDVAVRIPKPFEMGAVSTIVERLTEQMVDKDVEGKVFGKRLLAVLADNLAINPIPQVVRPLYDIARNKDGFTDRPIESMGQERVSPENRVSAGTSGAAVTLGTLNSLLAEGASAVTGGAVNANNMKLSPVQYDYLLRGYLGWVGTVIQTVSTEAAKPFKDGESPDRKIDDYLVVGNYVKSLPQAQSRYVSSFYENSKQIATATADYRSFLAAGDIDKAREVFEDKKNLIALNKLYSRTQDQMSAISKRMKLIQDDEKMDGAAKRVEMDRLSQLRIEYAKRAEEIRVARQKGS